MTEREKKVIEHLVEAHKAFVELDEHERQHPADLPEWVRTMHDLQRMVMSRAAVRESPDIFPIKR